MWVPGWGRKASPKKYEETLLSSVPPTWAGPLMITVVSFIVFSLVWMGLAKRPTSRRIMKKFKLQTAIEDCYSQFDPKTGSSHRFFKAELATRVVSTIHACVCCFGAIRSLLGEPSLAEDMLWSSLPVSKFYFSISLAYFIGNTLVCSVQFREYGVLFLLHGLSSIIGLSLLCFGDMFHFFGCIALLWEFSTIFINNRWFLLEYGYKQSMIFHLNGFALVACFCLVRILVGCSYSYIFWSQLSDARADGQIGRGLYLLVTTVLAGFNSLNMYWGYKLTSRSLRLAHRWLRSTKGPRQQLQDDSRRELEREREGGRDRERDAGKER